MSEYRPDNWVIVQINNGVDPLYYKVLAGWSGGYLDGDSWRLNSGITKIEEDGEYYLLIGETGSVYKCHKESETVRMNISSALTQLLATNKVKQIPINEMKLEVV